MPQSLLIIVFDEEVAAPGPATAFEVIAPMRSSGFLAETRGSHDGCRYCHQVGRLPGLQTRLSARLPDQRRQVAGAPVNSRGFPETSGVAGHGLLQRRDHGSIDQARFPMISCRRSAGWGGFPQPHGDPAGENQALQERVRGQPISAVHPRGRYLAARVHPDQVRCPVDICLHTATEVMARRRNRDQIRRRVDPSSAAAVPDGGEPHPPGLLCQHSAVNIDVIGTGCRHLLHDLFGDNISRG